MLWQPFLPTDTQHSGAGIIIIGGASDECSVCHVSQLLGTLAVYLFHYFVVIAHFHFAARADYGGEDEHKVTWMATYIGYGVSILGQILMLKNSDLLPGACEHASTPPSPYTLSLLLQLVTRRTVDPCCHGYGELALVCLIRLQVGIALISQHGGIWALVLALWPFAHCEELVEVRDTTLCLV